MLAKAVACSMNGYFYIPFTETAAMKIHFGHDMDMTLNINRSLAQAVSLNAM